MNVAGVLDRIARLLREQDVEFAAIGGLALAGDPAMNARRGTGDDERVPVEESAEEFAASRRAVQAWQRPHPVSFPDPLAWIDSLRRVIGDPPVDRRPSVGDDYRI